jgi:hypothetical protein
LPEHLEHPVLIELAVPKVCLGINSHLKLPGLLCGCGIDARRGQFLQMITALTGIDDVNGLVAACEPVADERQQDAIRLDVAVEKGARVAVLAKLGSSKSDGFGLLGHRVARSIEICFVGPALTAKFRTAWYESANASLQSCGRYHMAPLPQSHARELEGVSSN